MTELGNKHECLGCSTKFYDLGKSELICPKCGENQKDLAADQDSSTGKEKKKRKAPAKKKAKAAAKKKVSADPAAETATTDDDKTSKKKAKDVDTKD